MAKPKNYVIARENQDELVRLQEEYEMIGRETQLEKGKLIIFALPQRKRKK